MGAAWVAWATWETGRRALSAVAVVGAAVVGVGTWAARAVAAGDTKRCRDPWTRIERRATRAWISTRLWCDSAPGG